MFYIEGVRLEFISMLSAWSKKKTQPGDKALGQGLTLFANSAIEYRLMLREGCGGVFSVYEGWIPRNFKIFIFKPEGNSWKFFN